MNSKPFFRFGLPNLEILMFEKNCKDSNGNIENIGRYKSCVWEFFQNRAVVTRIKDKGDSLIFVSTY